MVNSVFRLKVQQVHQVSCLFELSRGKGKQLSATLPYPKQLFKFYQQWQQAYLNFYKTALRARVAETGTLKPNSDDWHRKLVEGEAKLLYEFHQWLQNQKLYELRREIARTAHQITEEAAKENRTNSYHLDIFLTCNSIELERLPWESWEIGSEFGSKTNIRLTRTPFNIRTETDYNGHKIKRSRIRILAILGDDTGLNFQADREALSSLQKRAEIEFVGWQPGQTPETIKTQIQERLIDERGWDVLFFAGHSNETVLTGGELAIAPGVSITVKEIAPQLEIAKAKGLQFALFNSCSGLSIANSLIDLGLSQVAVMREPIHNQVAQIFLVWFLQSLAEYKDVHDALMAACEHLKQKQNLTYPSAYLIPSLFSHPDAPLFRIKPWGWKHRLKHLFPTPIEAIALSAVTVVSLISPVENFLLEGRILVQSIYRDVTGQLPTVTRPPVRLVQIDERSIIEAGISDAYPMNRTYLASIIDQLTTLDAQVIGIDYLFDRPQPEGDSVLAESVRTAVAEKGIWFIFAAILNPEGIEIGVETKTGIAEPNWSLQGYTNALPQYVRLPDSTDCTQTCPFAYLVAMVWALHQQPLASDLPQPQLFEGRSQKAEGKRQKAKGRRQKSEGRSQIIKGKGRRQIIKGKGRRQKSEGRKQKAESRRQKTLSTQHSLVQMEIKGAGKGGQKGVSEIGGGISGLGTKKSFDTNTFSFSDFFLPSLFSLTGQEATVSIVQSSESIVQSSIERLEYKPGDFRTQLFDFVNSRNNHHDTVLFLRQARFHPLTNLSQNFGQFWLRPIIDFSLPPDVAYNHIPAWELLNGTEELKNSRFDQQIAIIAPCGYDEAGITPGSDNFPVPLAVAYWRERLGLTSNSSGKFTGSEVHGYMIHHLLTQRLVIPIPNLWAIALAGLLGKGVMLVLEKHYRQRQLFRLSLTVATAIYGLVGLQIYVTAEVLLPWLLPSATFLVYVWFFSRNKS